MIQKMENAIEAFDRAKKFERKQEGTDAVFRAVDDALKAEDESRDDLELSEVVGRIFFTICVLHTVYVYLVSACSSGTRIHF